MGYKEAMEAAGAEVLAYEEFGSYQGDWYAKIKFRDKVSWVQDCYGSCSSCDAFESDFQDSGHDCVDGEYNNPLYDEFLDDCEECQIVKKKLIRFGREYIDQDLTYEDCVKKASENLDWDMDAQKIVDWLEFNK